MTNFYTVSQYRPKAEKSPPLVYYSGSKPPSSIKGATHLSLYDYNNRKLEKKQEKQPWSALFNDKKEKKSPQLLELRGLINQGNLCFANAIFQSLVFCQPFYQLFIQLGRELPFSFNKTPLLDATIMFLNEFRVLDDDDIQLQTGEPFTPTSIYDAMKTYNRFSQIQLGQQEDAEEFLGFFLDTLHEELLSISPRLKPRTGTTLHEWFDGLLPTDQPAQADDGWLEVGHKNKTLSTKSTNTQESPLTKMFGGKFRSVLKTPGQKDSITLEPFQPLQLDIQPDNIHTIEDALINLAQPETIHGVHSSSKQGPVDARKQVTIDTCPPILIIHLKRFLYDSIGGVLKSNKKIGYKSTLNIPNEIISPSKRPAEGLNYRLFAVVYHHGQSSGSGHYTIDVLRQNHKQWVHIDDIVMDLLDEKDVVITHNSKQNNNYDDKVAYLLLYSKI
ncbi:cysteine proteinase [Wallemia mellicola CBS 633.66]|uniref:Ubiquitin carboxyl-terminal hydrolase n=2 Tax=Wallemia mellicola TaxID=1708541 RepID=I4Y584_WALMC|nr:cysteine proteinase [Wallemia mellicola CBS 633.66]EIM19126.1 cysteine proteinase [Wallemia mellicola CBS 633.66]TIB96654.1 cysteine proteinase [Wallemia mellicola]TIC08667.1 cysteine proteinase [Wallemia mellicola]TIC09429.1 cysteine proteinase [Wallemia mellicola]|eukprot:XP_006960822.1 cysteine proteinase [Wallemia mellicola CBS 633.66]